MPIAITIIALLVVGAVVGSVLNFAGLFLGIPFVLIFIGLVIGKEEMERMSRVQQMKRFRESAKARKIQLDEADKITVI